MFHRIKNFRSWSIFIRSGLLFSVIVLLFPAVLFADHRTLDDARHLSNNLILSHIETHGNWGGKDDAFIQEIEALTEKDRILGYFVTINPCGYIVVVADPAKFPIRCYSDFSPEENTGMQIQSNPANQDTRMKDLTTQLLSKSPYSASAIKKWEYSKPLQNEAASFLVIGPLTSSVWHQGYPFNGLCPEVDGVRSPAGCLPVAMAQLMYYWQHPVRIQRTHSYLWSGSVLSTDNPSPYEWHKMQADYGWWWYGTPEEAEPVARLLKHIGIALESGYSPTGSSAYVSEALYALRNFFDYSEDVALFTRGYMTADDLMETVFRPDIEKNQPLLYAIYEGAFEGGHGAVVDGYENIAAGKFIHLNFGWGNVLGTNTWYHPDEINLGEGYDFSYTIDQTIIRNIKPMDHIHPNKTLKKVHSGVLNLETQNFAAAAFDTKNIAIVFEKSFGSWQHTRLDSTSGIFSVPENIPYYNYDIPKLIKTKQGQYAIAYGSVDPVSSDQLIKIQLEHVTDIPAAVTFDFESNTNEFSMCSFEGYLMIAGMDMEFIESPPGNFIIAYMPFVYRYNLQSGVRGKHYIGSVYFQTPPDLIAMASSSKFAVIVCQVNGNFYRYIIDPGFNVNGPLQINTGISGLVSEVSCIALDDMFMLAWSTIGDTNKIQAEMFSKTSATGIKQLTLEASYSNQISGMLAAVSSHEAGMATSNTEGCGIQVYASDLSRTGHPAWEGYPGSFIPKTSISKVSNSRMAALWLTTDGIAEPVKVAYSIVQNPITLPFLMLLGDDGR